MATSPSIIARERSPRKFHAITNPKCRLDWRASNNRVAEISQNWDNHLGVLEVVESHDGNAYRAAYTVRFEKAVYVLHAFSEEVAIRHPDCEEGC